MSRRLALVVDDLAAAKARAVQSVGRFAGLARRTVEAAWEAGRDLQAVRDASPHGTYRAWIEEENISWDLQKRLRKLHSRFPQKVQVAPFGSVAEALGTGKLARPGNATHNNDDEWYTPPEVVEAARRALGGIDLDLASCKAAQETVRAGRYFTKEDDGLSQPWAGRVFLNPPFSVKAGKAAFVAKLADHYVAGDVEAAVLVTSVDFGGEWAVPIWKHVAATCLGRGRTKFYHPEKRNDPALPSAFHYFGRDVARFGQAFEPLGQAFEPRLEVLRNRERAERLKLMAEPECLSLGGHGRIWRDPTSR